MRSPFRIFPRARIGSTRSSLTATAVLRAEIQRKSHSGRGEKLSLQQFPNIARACERLPPDGLLDGEIVALDENGRVSFNLLQHHRSKAQALLFYAFDVLIYRGRSLVELPLSTRREVLGEIFKERDSGASQLAISESINATPADLVRVARE